MPFQTGWVEFLGNGLSEDHKKFYSVISDNVPGITSLVVSRWVQIGLVWTADDRETRGSAIWKQTPKKLYTAG